MSKIAVVGLGGVGGYLCASLHKTSNDVVGFARDEHLKKIKDDGIKSIEDEKEWNISLNVKSLKEAQNYFDVVIFCVKSYDLISSYEAIKECIDSKTVIVCFSNGVEHGEILREISDSKVLDGCIYILSHIQEAGIIRKKGKVFAAVFGGDDEASMILKEIFDKASLRVKIPSDIKTAIWKKYIFISAFATLTSFYNKSIGYIYENHYDEAKQLLNEIASVAMTKGINIEEEIQKALDTASSLPYDASTSMHKDFKNEKRDELKTLSGYIVKEAYKSNTPTPLMKKMYENLLARHIE